jgi:formate dehydrogenase major subunit
MALRGHASIQGSTDIPTLYNILPGYIPMPHAHAHEDLKTYLELNTAPSGYWGNMDAYVVSLLKAYWGEHATERNDFCFDHLPRLTGDHSAYQAALAMLDGSMKGYLLLGENPAVGSSNSRLHRLALANLDWLVVRDLYEIESATFWYDSPELETGEIRAEDCKTEIFLLPAAAHVEKDGSFTNTQRLLQWHVKAVEPTGDRRSDLWFVYHLGRRIREKLAASTDAKDRPIQQLQWHYPTQGELEEPSAEAVLREINGWDASGSALPDYTELKADGSTVCGCWIYCGVYAGETNHAADRKPHWEQDWVARGSQYQHFLWDAADQRYEFSGFS